MKKTLVIMLCCVFSLALFTGCGSKKKDKSNIPNSAQDQEVNEKVNKDAEVDGFSITNVVLVKEETGKSFKATITNTTNEAKTVKFLTVTFKDDKDVEIKKVKAMVDNTIQPGGTYNLVLTLSADVMDAENVTYVFE